MKLTDVQVKLVVWALGLTAVTVLIALGKLPADAIKYALMYAAGTLGGALKLPGITGGTDPAQPTETPAAGQPGAPDGK